MDMLAYAETVTDEERLRQSMRDVVQAISEYRNGVFPQVERVCRADPFCGPRLVMRDEEETAEGGPLYLRFVSYRGVSPPPRQTTMQFVRTVDNGKLWLGSPNDEQSVDGSPEPFYGNGDDGEEGFLLSESRCMEHVEDTRTIFDFIWTRIKNKHRDIYGAVGVEEWTSRAAIDYYLETDARLLMQLILAALKDSDV